MKVTNKGIEDYNKLNIKSVDVFWFFHFSIRIMSKQLY